jgi:hypothetical protein
MAEILKRWHNYGQEIIFPENKIIITKEEMAHWISYYINCNLYYIPHASKIITYNNINNMFHHNMEYFFNILGKQFKTLEKPFIKNPENPKDFIENYEELEYIYNVFYTRLV